MANATAGPVPNFRDETAVVPPGKIFSGSLIRVISGEILIAAHLHRAIRN